MANLGLVVAPHQKRFFLTIGIILMLVALFWTQSRYPALDEKAMMSGAIQLEDPLSFEAHYPIDAADPVWKRIGLSTLNWLHTNRKGMTFGLLLAAAFLTLSKYLQRKSFKDGFLNSLLGMFIGAPLGVCVNCAAPIAKGLYASGARAETTLAMMIASPTLNIVVLTMAFSLLPAYMAIGKIVLSLVLILGVVPLIGRLLPDQKKEITPPVPATGWDIPTPADPWGTAIWEVVKSYAANLWYIIKLTVPLMILAGFLGAVVATLLPSDLIIGLAFGIGTMIVIAIVGTFLPVPIAFDVVVAGALLSAGLSAGYVMGLVFTLGSFSVYSYFIVAQAISWRAASMLAAAVAVAGILAGVAAQSYHNWQSERALELLLGFEAAIFGAAHADTGGITVQSTPFAALSPQAPDAATPFERLEGHDIGIDKPIEFSMHDMWPPFWEGRSLASGDIDNDGDMDLVIASSERGLYVYDNDGTGKFAPRTVDLAGLAGIPIFNAALVDIDNDGWRDLFLATYRNGNHILWNAGGTFDRVTPVANRDNAILSLALSFGDIDRDGDLDAAIGNWASGWYRRVPGDESRNRLILNGGTLSGETFAELPGIPGETLSILLSDFTGDGALDLWVANDFEIPDAVYASGGGGLKQLLARDGIIPHTTTTTMAVKTADLHNDGTPEIYLAQIAGRSSGVSDTLKMQPLGAYCDGIKHPKDHAICVQNMEIKSWYKSGNNFDPTYASKCTEFSGDQQAQCKAMLVKDLAIQRDDPALCDLIADAQLRAKSYCQAHFQPIRPFTDAERAENLHQILRSNVLLQRDGNGFTDVAQPQGLDVGGWSWDTKVADFDNDGFQDVYIVNGTWVPNEVSPSNLFFHNDGNGKFTEASGPFGLEDYLMTAAATVFDMDGDGDQDIITHPVNGPITVFRNAQQSDHALSVRLIDHRGNRDGIGSLITLYTDTGQQSRELQLGGGFMSFDAPVAHFGLAANDVARRISIRWSTGETTTLEGPFDTATHYEFTRP